jgi:hypothetical protein
MKGSSEPFGVRGLHLTPVQTKLMGPIRAFAQYRSSGLP